MKGIDVAKWNGVIDWKKVKNAGVQFAILKAINKQCKVEDAFDRNYAGALSVGLPIDVYNYSYATTETKAKTDAQAVLNAIKGKNIGTVWLDVEDKIQQNLGMTLVNIINVYREVIEKAGYGFGVYTGLSFYNTLLRPYHSFLDCKFWIARYPSRAIIGFDFEPDKNKKPNIINKLWGWQYSSTCRIDGINGNVDVSLQYDAEEKSESGIVQYSLAHDGNIQISKNFKVREFRCKDGSDAILIDVDFVKDNLQKIRDHFGVPITINSAYRTSAHNTKVGGAKNSYHMKGQAFDIVVKGKTPNEVARFAQTLGVNGIIQYNSFVHVDSRATKRWAINDNGKVTNVTGF